MTETSQRPEPMRARRKVYKSNREHVNRWGTPKKKMSRRGAEAAAARFGMNAYRCPACGAWHVGSRHG